MADHSRDNHEIANEHDINRPPFLAAFHEVSTAYLSDVALKDIHEFPTKVARDIWVAMDGPDKFGLGGHRAPISPFNAHALALADFNLVGQNFLLWSA